MRIWSLHPKYLDGKGLVALWREALLAKKVLENKTKGYRNHPQLNRFNKLKSPVDAINQYLSYIYQEAQKRNYKFNRNKINQGFNKTTMTVTRGQLDYEAKHLMGKLLTRNPEKYLELKATDSFETHPIFKIIDGDVEDWEILVTKKGLII